MVMKNMVLVFGISLVLLTSCKEKNTEPEIISIDTTVEKKEISTLADASFSKAEFTIKGMTCQIGCAATIEKKLAKMEGFFLGNSAGAAIKGLLQLKDNFTKDDVVVVLFHDHGSRYVGKFFNQDWMKERGFVETKTPTAKDLVSTEGNLVVANHDETISSVVEKMSKFNISQIPVFNNEEIVGQISETKIFNHLFANPSAKSDTVGSIMEEAFPIVDLNTSFENISKLITKENAAVMVKKEDNSYHIITKQDVIRAIS